MNELIKVLANEAGLPTYNPEGIPNKLEKFAELIIEQCVNKMWSESSFRNDVMKEMKEHFGVKE